MSKKIVLLLVCLAGFVLAAASDAAAFWGRAGYSFYSRCAGTVCLPSCYEIGEQVSLFNGTDLTGWTNASGGTPGPGWMVRDGAIYHEGSGTGDLFTEKCYDNFILEFEFKMESGTNSGLKYRLWNEEGSILGCEYQIAEEDSDNKVWNSSALYDLFAPNNYEGLLKRDGYNQAKVVVKGNHIEHWLNGVCTVSVMVNSPEWCEHFMKSKFAEYPEYGQYRATPLFFQDHGTPVWLKNITIRELKPLY